MVRIIFIVFIFVMIFFMFFKMYKDMIERMEAFDKQAEEICNKWLEVIEKMEEEK